jgi:ATP-dependent Clp protease ATP-binding subunit ClpC
MANESLPLSPAAQAVMSSAADESHKGSHGYLGVEHMFVALADVREAEMLEAFESQALDLKDFTDQLRSRVQPLEDAPWGKEILVTPRCQHVMRLAAKIASRHKKSQVTDEHLLDAIFREGRSIPIRLLRAQDAQVAELWEMLAPQRGRVSDVEQTLLARFGRNLTAQARAGLLMPVIGREAEMDQLAEVLLRKRKNNPVLIGEAGVGKTAVVEGLAAKLARQKGEHPLKKSRIIELSVASLVAGTKYRGDFEERILGILKEASDDPDAVLFLDEIHTLVGAGSSSGEAVGASEIVKPALARGDLRCIGATTIDEYRRHIEKDAALERRFEPVMIEEPTPAETREILTGVVPALSDHHGVDIAPEAVEAAVDLTVRYVPGRRLPDKAIDALDQCGARLRLATFAEKKGEDAPKPTVDRDSVTTTVSQWTGIPLERLSGEETGDLLELEERLRSRVLGQNRACRAVARAVITAKAGLSDPDRPTGVFMFLGPTGVGKTELAKSLAQLLFGDEKRLVRFDMSEFTEPHSIAKLIGAPPGYVGHEQEGQLVAAVRTHPHCVVLFDEIEKAHAQIFDLFLQIFDEGRLSGSRGQQADFRNAIVILTSNLQVNAGKRKTLGFATEESDTGIEPDPRAALATTFRPELVNRIDDILVFDLLGEADLRTLIDRYVHGLEKLAADRELRIEMDDDVYDFLIEHGVSEQFGARELKRAIDRWVRQPLAEELIRRGNSAGVIRVRLDGETLRFE